MLRYGSRHGILRLSRTTHIEPLARYCNYAMYPAYYYMEDDGNNFGGTRYVAGSHFRLG